METLVLTLQSRYASLSNFVTLQQEQLSVDAALSFIDVSTMFSYINSGRTARDYVFENGCPITYNEDGVTINLNFYVFPSALDLPYSLETTQGTLSERSILTEYQEEFSYVIAHTDEIDLGYIPGDIDIEWETRAYNEYGEVIARPAYTIYGSKIFLEHSCFGVVRIRVSPRGYQYTLTLTATYADPEGEEITDLNTALPTDPITDEAVAVNEDLGPTYVYMRTDFSKTIITATFIDSSGKEAQTVLDIKVPKCIDEFLTACISYTTFYTINPAKKYIVEYNSCDGTTLKVYRNRNV